MYYLIYRKHLINKYICTHIYYQYNDIYLSLIFRIKIF